MVFFIAKVSVPFIQITLEQMSIIKYDHFSDLFLRTCSIPYLRYGLKRHGLAINLVRE